MEFCTGFSEFERFICDWWGETISNREHESLFKGLTDSCEHRLVKVYDEEDVQRRVR